MALFYFDVDHNGEKQADDDGTECVDLHHVKQEAIRALVEMVNDELPDGDHHSLSIKVRDDGGTTVLQVGIRFDVADGFREGIGQRPEQSPRA